MGSDSHSWFMWLPRLVLLLLVIIAPWLNGGVEASSQVGLYAAVLGALFLWGVAAALGGTRHIIIPTLTWIIVAATAWGAFQLLPVFSTDGWFPGFAALEQRVEYQAALGESAQGNSNVPLSLAPDHTQRELALMLAALTTFFLAAQLLRQPQWFGGLLGCLAINGALISIFGVIQRLTWNGKLFWTIPLTQGGSPFGPFVYHNQAGNYLGMCLIAAIVWVPLKMSEARGDSPEGWNRSYRRAGVSEALRAQLAELNGRRIALLAVLVLNIAGVLLALSRGAIVACTLAVLCASLLAWRSAGKAPATSLAGLGFAACVAFAVIVWVGMNEALGERFASLFTVDALSMNGRIEHWKDAIHAAGLFAGVGAGLGAYRYVYLPHQERPFEAWFDHAHNQYLEALVDGGIPALVLLLSALALLGAAAWWLMSSPNKAHQAAGYVGVGMLVFQAVHAGVDYCLYLPATALVFAALCGAITGRAADERRRWWSAVPRGDTAIRRLGIALGGVLAVAMVWSVNDTRKVAAIEAALRSAPLRDPDALRTISEARLTESLERLSSALAARSNSAEAYEAAAVLWMTRYRHQARRQLSEELRVPLSEPALWEWTAPLVLHHAVHSESAAARGAKVSELRRQEVVQSNLIPAWGCLDAALRSCPMLPRSQLYRAELSVLNPESDDERLVDTAAQLAPCDASVLFDCGRVHFSANRFEPAYAAWRQCLRLGDVHFGEIVRLAKTRLDAAGLADHVLPDSPVLLARLALEEYTVPSARPARQDLLERARKLLDRASLPPGEREHLRGVIAADQERLPEATEAYRRAVHYRPDRVQWRYELALLLREQRAYSEALREARWCVRLRPDIASFRRLLADLNDSQQGEMLSAER